MTDPGDGLARTRAALHAVAELVLAGPQHRVSNTIRLCVSPGGFRTIKDPDVRVVGADVVVGGARCPIPGATARSIGAALGIDAGGPVDVYHDGSGATLDDELSWDDEAAADLVAAWELGDAALRLFAPDEQPVLWPEHFDVAIRVEEVNYGVSQGDGHVPVPYAYIGVHSVPSDSYWNAPFGRTRPVADFDDAGGLRDFFADGRARLLAPDA